MAGNTGRKKGQRHLSAVARTSWNQNQEFEKKKKNKRRMQLAELRSNIQSGKSTTH